MLIVKHVRIFQSTSNLKIILTFESNDCFAYYVIFFFFSETSLDLRQVTQLSELLSFMAQEAREGDLT